MARLRSSPERSARPRSTPRCTEELKETHEGVKAASEGRKGEKRGNAKQRRADRVAKGKEEKVGFLGAAAAALHAMLGTCDCCFLTLLFLFAAQTDNPVGEEAET